MKMKMICESKIVLPADIRIGTIESGFSSTISVQTTGSPQKHADLLADWAALLQAQADDVRKQA